MAGSIPGRAGTRRGAKQNQASHILRHRQPCANCRTPLTGREFRYCTPCRGWLRIYAATVEAAKMFREVQP